LLLPFPVPLSLPTFALPFLLPLSSLLPLKGLPTLLLPFSVPLLKLPFLLPLMLLKSLFLPFPVPLPLPTLLLPFASPTLPLRLPSDGAPLVVRRRGLALWSSANFCHEGALSCCCRVLYPFPLAPLRRGFFCLTTA
jgi:hypothetical protein